MRYWLLFGGAVVAVGGLVFPEHIDPALAIAAVLVAMSGVAAVFYQYGLEDGGSWCPKRRWP